jgi:hypothetical protein
MEFAKYNIKSGLMDKQKKPEIRYILDGLKITTEYINKHRAVYSVPTEVPDEVLYRHIERNMMAFLTNVKEGVRHIFVPSSNSFVQFTDKYPILSLEHFVKFSENVANLYLKASVESDFIRARFEDEINIEVHAYYYNSIGHISEFTTSPNVETNPDQKALLNSMNNHEHSILRNKKLLSKIDHGRDNPFLLSLQDDVRYLSAKLSAQVPIKTPYIIPPHDIAKLHPLFEETLWEKDIDFTDFVQYWRLGKKPAYLPIKPRMTSAFIFLLDRFFHGTKYTDSVIEETFNLKPIKSKRSKFHEQTPAAKKVRKLMQTLKNT